MVYHFKSIRVVPSSKDFVNIILSMTQRKTPTVVHKGYKISRIRRFYATKIRFTQENFVEKITEILADFPRLDDIHPFYNDLINVLYSRDHYKIALGQLSTAKNLIANVGKDYLAMNKFGDSLYRCKELKRAALGRMCTIVKKLNTALQYLEQVRQHLSRLPTIDPNTRTLLITGYPNTGKSSYINKVSNANVEVQSYAFTTKSLYVGHFAYNYTQWQIIDTPGILDHPLEERNTIEMQSITALAHLNATVLFFIDVSETCGYSLSQQISLFHHVKALFKAKPLLIIANKTDVKRLSDLTGEEREMVEGMKSTRGDDDTQIIEMSNHINENIDLVKNTACNMLVVRRVDKKERSQRINDIANRITFTLPERPRDDKERPICIPDSVRKQREERKKAIEAFASTTLSSSSMTDDVPSRPHRKTEREIELENGGPGIYNIDLRKNYVLANPEWKYDIQPEFMEGKNVADFFDPEVLEHLDHLEKEEEMLMNEWMERKALAEEEDTDSDLDEEQKQIAQQIRDKKAVHIQEANLRKTNNKPVKSRPSRPKSVDAAAETLREMGIPTEKMLATVRAKSRERGFLKRGRSQEDEDDLRMSDEDGETKMADGEDGGRRRGRSLSRSAPKRDPSVPREGETDVEYRFRMRSRSATRADSVPRKASPSPFRNVKQKMDAERIAKAVQKPANTDARMGEGDRHYYDKKPKHLYSGKRGIGKTDRR